jgi:hypothetical protein
MAEEQGLNDQISSTKVHIPDHINVLSNVQHYTDQKISTYDTYLLKRNVSNTISNSTNMNHKWEESDQDAECDEKSSSLFTTENFKSNDMVDKEVYYELSKRFSQLEKHCISLVITMQQKEESLQINQQCKNPELPEFREYFVINDLKAQLEEKNLTINTLRKQNAVLNDVYNNRMTNNVDTSKMTELELKLSVLHNENVTLIRNCKTLNEYVKEERTKTGKHTTSLIASDS